MINRYISLLLLTGFSILYGEQNSFDSRDRIYFLAGEVSLKNDDAVAYKGATAIFQDKYMQAETIVYDQHKKEIEFFSDVSLVEKGLYFFAGDYAKVSIDGNASITNMFLYHKPRHIWLYSSESNATDKQFILNDTFLSSCRSEDPDWGFYVEEGYFHKDKQLFELYNIMLYATDVPILWLPYINFSTSRERKTGLLVPEIGISNDEGMVYAQPIYYVPNHWSDVEITPQIRTERGKGIYTTYRFVDSPYSKGSLTAGYFQESESYRSAWDLAHSQHYGLEINYQRNSIFRTLDDALLVDITYLNDIEYLTLKQYKSSSSQNTNLIESKINYYTGVGNHKFGLYNRYLIDTDVEESDYSNDTTLQTLPHFQYHYGLKSLLNRILYSVDYNYKNFTREQGATATQHDVTIPLVFYWNLFDNYLHFKLTEHFYGSYIEFGDTELYQDERNSYLRHYHQIEFFTDLSKRYRSGMFHSLDFGVNLLIPDIEKKSGFYTPVTDSEEVTCHIGEPCEFQREEEIDSTLELQFSQYLYNSSGDEIFYHKAIQPIAVEDGKIVRFETLDNEFRWRVNKPVSIYSSTNYSFIDDKFTKIFLMQFIKYIIGLILIFLIYYFYKKHKSKILRAKTRTQQQ